MPEPKAASSFGFRINDKENCMDINIKVKDKIAVGDETLIVCGNSDYTVNFELDAEWDAYDKKTMRIGYRNGKYKDVEFNGTSCQLPVINKRPWIAVGGVSLRRVHNRQG